MKKNGFSKSQNTIIETVDKYLKNDDSFATAVVMTALDTGFMDWYIIDTYNSHRNMMKVTA